MWEEDGFDGLATSFRRSATAPALQDPKLAKWWAEAAKYRRRGDDRVLVPAPWTRTIEELCADGVHRDVFAHEQVECRRARRVTTSSTSPTRASPCTTSTAGSCPGAWETAMVNETECFLLWAIPTWEQWASFEEAAIADSPLRSAQRTLTSGSPVSTGSCSSTRRCARSAPAVSPHAMTGRAGRSDPWRSSRSGTVPESG